MLHSVISITPQANRTDSTPLDMLDRETRPYVNTSEAAMLLLRQPQTLRQWACSEKGLIQPIRAGVRLMWPVAEIRRIMGKGSSIQ